jgi:hypothetical protein
MEGLQVCEMAETEPARFEGIGLGLGIAAGATLCWVLPYILDGGPGWVVAGRIAAWVLYTIAAAGSLIEVENASGRLGFSDLGAGAVLISVGTGLLALGSQVLTGVWGAIAIVPGIGAMVFGLAGAGIGTGRIASGHPRVKAKGNGEAKSGSWSPSSRRDSRGLRRWQSSSPQLRLRWPQSPCSSKCARRGPQRSEDTRRRSAGGRAADLEEPDSARGFLSAMSSVG